MKRAIELTVWVALLGAGPVLAQGRPQTPPPPPPGVTPQPVGRGGEAAPQPAPSRPTTPRPAPVQPATGSVQPAGTPTGPAAPPRTPAALNRDGVEAPLPTAETAPSEAQLGVPIYPGATFIQSFNAGQGQRYYLFGTTGSFAELVAYYKTQLRKGGDLVYDEPPVHMFEVGRFREEAMAFPPGVTVKDYTWGGGKGYLVPTPGANPTRYPTIIQIVPVTAGR